jgi:hypothetical protein
MGAGEAEGPGTFICLGAEEGALWQKRGRAGKCPAPKTSGKSSFNTAAQVQLGKLAQVCLEDV